MHFSTSNESLSNTLKVCTSTRLSVKVIHEDRQEFEQYVDKDVHNQPLKCHRRITQPKWHDNPHKTAPRGGGCHLVDVLEGNKNLVVAHIPVHECVPHMTTDLLQQ